MKEKKMEENRTLSTGLKVWLWIIFVINIVSALVMVAGVAGSAALGSVLGLGAIYTVLCVVSLILEIVLIAGLAMLLFKSKKMGFYLICAAAGIGFVVNMITYGVIGSLTAANVVRAIISMVLCPLITYLFAKNDWDYLK